jgi:hypothetical protein
MNDALPLLAVFVFGNLFLVAFFMVLNALFPRRVSQTRTVADKMPGRAFLAGLINVAFFAAIILVFSALADWIGNGLPRVPAVVVLAILSMGLSFGLAGVVELIGERVRPQSSALTRTAWGALTLSFASTLPFIGWFALLPYAACLGLGAFIISFFYREHPAPTAE